MYPVYMYAPIQTCAHIYTHTLSTFDFPILSEPAKSTKLSLDTVYFALDCTLDLD